MATDVPDYSELDDVFQIRIQNGKLPEFDLRDDLGWKYKLRPWKRFTVRQFYFWHKTIYFKDNRNLAWLPRLMHHDNQTEAVGRRYFLTKECRITKRAANRLDYGPLIEEVSQTVVVPELRKFRAVREFWSNHSVAVTIAIISTAIGVAFTVVYAK